MKSKLYFRTITSNAPLHWENDNPGKTRAIILYNALQGFI